MPVEHTFEKINDDNSLGEPVVLTYFNIHGGGLSFEGKEIALSKGLHKQTVKVNRRGEKGELDLYTAFSTTAAGKSIVCNGLDPEDAKNVLKEKEVDTTGTVEGRYSSKKAGEAIEQFFQPFEAIHLVY